MTDNAARDGDVKPSIQDRVKRELREWGMTLSIFVPLFLVFSGLVYELRVIPSESMVPNLQVGDRVTVNKFAYGYSRHSLPFSMGRYVPLPEGRIFARQPKRGDVAVFEHPHTQRVMIKRIIGIPGDRVEVRQGQIYLNGSPIERTFERKVDYLIKGDRLRSTASEYRETIGEKSWISHDLESRGGPHDNTPAFEVPEGMFLFMGDNRDNSLDGRALTGHCPTVGGVISEGGCDPRPGVSDTDASVGFVPFQNLIGRADTVLFTTYRCSRVVAEPCMKKRLWRGL